MLARGRASQRPAGNRPRTSVRVSSVYTGFPDHLPLTEKQLQPR